jgi:DHA1 family bicyclomycin/chloramphenicol resistance-like MFS transporter
MMAYVASSPFLYQVVLHFEPATYGLLFAANALVAVLVNLFVNHRLRHVGSHRIVRWGFGVSLVGTAGTGVSLLAGAPPLPVVVFVCVSMCTFGMTGANVVALALNRMASGIGTAAAVIGFVQFVTGASVSPLVGLAGGDTQIVPLALMTVAAATGLVLIGRAPGAASTPSVRE